FNGCKSIRCVHKEVNAKLGSDTKLSCKVKTPDIISQVTWQRKLSPNNENFLTYSKGEEPMHLTPFGQRVKFLGNGDLGGSILIPNVTLADQGTYLCIFTTFPGGTKEGEIHLSIWVFFVFKIHFGAKTSAEIPCPAHWFQVQTQKSAGSSVGADSRPAFICRLIYGPVWPWS
uniref:Ig-like domain-containing protein n=1 Tax=Xenopus tropicalis TaxID=8364 RepID=F6PNC6_XENTR